MAYDLQEQEQIEQLKDVWNRYGNFVTAVVVLAALAVGGYNAWNWYQGTQAEKASRLYEQMSDAITAKNMNLVKETSGALMDKFGRTAYAEMGALEAAHAEADAGDLKGAQGLLEWASQHAADEPYRWSARLRLTAVLIDEHDLPAARAALSGTVPPAFAAPVADRLGDIDFADNKLDAAKSHYQAALAALDQASSDVKAGYTQVLKVKLDAVAALTGVTVAAAAASPAGVPVGAPSTPGAAPAQSPPQSPPPSPAASPKAAAAAAATTATTPGSAPATTPAKTPAKTPVQVKP